MASISKTTYKDVDAVAVENSVIKAVFLPAYGGKMASLVCRKTDREFLVQADGEMYKKLDYAGAYEPDLIVALQNGEIAGAGLDVLMSDKVDKSNPLLAMDNVIITPTRHGTAKSPS